MEDHLARCKSITKFERIDAGFGLVSSRHQCEKWGACWDKTAIGSAPSCYYAFDNGRGYKVSKSNVTSAGMEIDLARIESKVKLSQSEESVLKCIISYETDSRLRVKIYNPNEESRYEVPISGGHETNGHRMQYVLDFTEELFGFSVSRTHEASSTILNTTLDGLIFSDQLLQINMMLSSKNVYGLSGDHKDGLLRKMEYNYQSIWSTSVEKRHGAHPFLLHVEDDGHASGIFLQNSNAMDVILNPYPAVTFRTTGGILDFYIFLGPSAADVMSQFSDKIGRTFMPPLWALGYHFGSENYKNTAEITASAVVSEDSFPLDGIWLGSSTLQDGQELTLDSDSFTGLGEAVTQLHGANKYLLVDTRPSILTNSSMYAAGQAPNVFVRTLANDTLVGKVSAGDAVFPDYFHPETVTWLTDGLTAYRGQVSFDGLYLTDNEPSTLSDGSVDGCTADDMDNPLYTLYNYPKLKRKTLCASSRHHGDLHHYDVHNIYGWKSSQVTSRALSAAVPSQRTLLLSRSTYLGSGAMTGHFIRDNTPTWADMKHSIVAMLNYNMYGIPLVGANICGYTEAAVPSDFEELCVRWHQLATFYPFAKRYSSTAISMREFSDSGVDIIRESIKHRYTLLPVLYTLFYTAHTQGTPVVRPLFFDYLSDDETLKLETQFMFGPSIMVAPVLEKGVSSHSVYFPDDVWYDYKNPTNVDLKGHKDEAVTLEEQTYYVRGGNIVIRYKNIANTTSEMNTDGDYILDVYLGRAGHSYGELFSDDGVTLDTILNDQYLFVKFNATQEHIRSEVTLKYPGHDNTNKIQEINVRGLAKEPTTVTVKDSDVVADYTYDQETKVLCIKSLNLPVKEAFSVQYQ